MPTHCEQGRKLDAILVLRVQDGNDIFCSVGGTYLPSFFGLSLATLAPMQRYGPMPAAPHPAIPAVHVLW